MEALQFSWGAASLATVQALGLLFALFVRWGEQSSLQTWCHRAFFVLLLLAGVATAAAVAFGPGATLLSGATLAIMAVAAVFEARPADNVETF